MPKMNCLRNGKNYLETFSLITTLKYTHIDTIFLYSYLFFLIFCKLSSHKIMFLSQFLFVPLHLFLFFSLSSHLFLPLSLTLSLSPSFSLSFSLLPLPDSISFSIFNSRSLSFSLFLTLFSLFVLIFYLYFSPNFYLFSYI